MLSLLDSAMNSQIRSKSMAKNPTIP